MRDSLRTYRLQILWWLAVGLIACALKWHYSAATVDALGWMLRPVALLLQVITGHSFRLSPGGEWYSESAGIVLVKGCAGVNFMIMSFVGWCWLTRPAPRVPLMPGSFLEWPALLGISLVMAWATAVIINLLRILVVVVFGTVTDEWLGAEQAHRLIGLAIYLPALCAQLVLGERRTPARALLMAVSTYVGMMLVMPLLTGNAYTQPAEFLKYALAVLALAVPLAVWGCVFALKARACRSARLS